MSITMSDARRLGRTDKPFNPGRRHRSADFARAATISAFGRHAWALDQADFEDRLPNQAARRINDQIAQEAA